MRTKHECKKCKKMFRPTGKYQKCCDDCIKISRKKGVNKMAKTRWGSKKASSNPNNQKQTNKNK